MKNIKFLLGLLTVVMMMASCAATQSAATDDEFAADGRTQQIGNRLYVQDPYYGTVILERDPFSGRYYDVTYGSRYGTPYYGYGYYPNRTYRRNGGYYRTYNGNGQAQQQTPSAANNQQNRSETRQNVLGSPKHQ